jgi:hypothetical protein
MATISSVAVKRPLFRMIPPTSPVPNSMSVRSTKTTSALCFLAEMAAAQPAHPAPTTITFMENLPFFSDAER